MAGKVLHLDDVLEPDMLGSSISERYCTWETLRSSRVDDWREISEYVFATDTCTTSNSKLDWSNKTTLPKLCQIRDNLHANYMATMFPNTSWLEWEGSTEDDQSQDKVEAIQSYMRWVTNRNQFYDTVSRLVYDYIDYGNCFAMPEWVDETVLLEDREQVGYVGPVLRRISPLDIVFNPTAPSFEETPKIVRSFVSRGELKDILRQGAQDEAALEEADALYEYLKEYRNRCIEHDGRLAVKDRIYDISGFTDYRSYLESDTVEILTFYGDLYDSESDVFLKNHCIKVVDRHKVFYKQPNPSSFGYPTIWSCGWRLRNDSLWAMGPLENIVGMQYRIDHLENMKSDVFDLTAYPPMKIKGYVEDFTWGPMERIYVGDDGDVELVSPNVQALSADTQISILEAKMEEMAGAPREALGFRSPGEKTKYEIQSIENAYGRMYQNKISQFERSILENSLNGMLDLARRNMRKTVVRVLDDEFKTAIFMELTRYDITGAGSIKPVAARHFAEKATLLQNLTGFFNSSAGADPSVLQHFSTIQLAKMYEELLDLRKFKVVTPFIRLDEQQRQQSLGNELEEQSIMQSQTAGGILPGDFDTDEQGLPPI